MDTTPPFIVLLVKAPDLVSASSEKGDQANLSVLAHQILYLYNVDSLTLHSNSPTSSVLYTHFSLANRSSSLKLTLKGVFIKNPSTR